VGQQVIFCVLGGLKLDEGIGGQVGRELRGTGAKANRRNVIWDGRSRQFVGRSLAVGNH